MFDLSEVLSNLVHCGHLLWHRSPLSQSDTYRIMIKHPPAFPKSFNKLIIVNKRRLATQYLMLKSKMLETLKSRNYWINLKKKKRANFCFIAYNENIFFPSDDNKPIWMHAEEREESKVLQALFTYWYKCIWGSIFFFRRN